MKSQQQLGTRYVGIAQIDRRVYMTSLSFFFGVGVEIFECMDETLAINVRAVFPFRPCGYGRGGEKRC